MSGSRIEKQVLERFEHECSQVDRQFESLKTQFTQIAEKYGETVARERFPGLSSMLLGSSASNGHAKAASTGSPARTRKRTTRKKTGRRKTGRRSRGARQKVDGYSFSDVRNLLPEVVRAVSQKHGLFTVNEVAEELERRKIGFDRSWLTTLLSRYLNGVNKVDTKERPSGGGLPMNVYEAGQKITARTSQKVS